MTICHALSGYIGRPLQSGLPGISCLPFPGRSASSQALVEDTCEVSDPSAFQRVGEFTVAPVQNPSSPSTTTWWVSKVARS